ncbi:tripartite tricarboxylate transporter TctB family protein [Streptomonospora wellingtoniae]|uniref:Tripartite tricarboxylate transporter TctB family protein n=1 Tax=Streptomonospora wellingtoniae TaxID=3075544 RepID=A0ABU2KN38_9ACTN|nr:tripartite tricarboxylate transporter TctB family protein [Streptomonospora sp. DSM 45055]MDT0300675.1 tripartite tricarboxylate transporter TctB family protein [Streptomonospora sp. DSM 45055]
MTPFGFSNRAAALVVGLFAVGYLVLAFRMPEFTAVEVPVQPSTLPRWLGVVLLLLAGLLFFQRGEPGEDGEQVPAAGASGTAGAEAAEGAEGRADAAEIAEGAQAGTAGGAVPAASLGRIPDARLELAAFAASIAAYILLFEPLGFLISSAAYVFGASWYLGYRRHWANALVSVGVPASLYFTMSEFLDVALPTGPLPF